MAIFANIFLLVFFASLIFIRRLPETARVLLLRLLPLIGVLTLLQIAFFYYNRHISVVFAQEIYTTLQRAFRVTTATAVAALLPSFVFFIVYNINKERIYLLQISDILYWLGATFVASLNIIDILYYPFVRRHLNIIDVDLLSRSVYLIPEYAVQLPFLLPIIIVLFLFFWQITRRINTKNTTHDKPIYTSIFTIFTIGFLTAFLPNPLFFKVFDVNVNEVFWTYELNGAFTLLCSATEPPPLLARKTYFSETECKRIFSPHQQFNYVTDTASRPKNIVLFFIESAPQEFFDETNADRPVMPFVDSLRRESWVFDNAFASSTSTDDAFMTVVGGIPYFTRTSLPFSAYSGNKFVATGHHLQEKGYFNSFYYGVNNNTSGFGRYARCFGIENYYDLNNLHLQPNAKGVQHDHLFIPYTAQKLAEQPQPFFSILFNVQTHTPFNFLPEDIAATLPKGKIDASRAFSYFDYTLRRYFAAARQQAWFANTIFIFVGDHFSRSAQQKAKSDLGRYRVPLWIYSPQKGCIAPHHTQMPVHQLDIAPTILDLLHYAKPFYSFGQSLCDSSANRKIMFRHDEGAYWCIGRDYALQYDDKKAQATALYRWRTDADLKQNCLAVAPRDTLADLLKHTRAVIQTYHNDLIDNKFW